MAAAAKVRLVGNGLQDAYSVIEDLWGYSTTSERRSIEDVLVCKPDVFSEREVVYVLPRAFVAAVYCYCPEGIEFVRRPDPNSAELALAGRTWKLYQLVMPDGSVLSDEDQMAIADRAEYQQFPLYGPAGPLAACLVLDGTRGIDPDVLLSHLDVVSLPLTFEQLFVLPPVP